tara:strand:- start:1907 stop:3664 length:1758 start_codon:yes stop_codon:yes gene_type:complete
MNKKAILGLQLGHNATAALLLDGKIIGSISQEKFDNIKNSSTFPRDPIKWLLNEFKIDATELQAVAVSGFFINDAALKVNSKTKTKTKKSLTNRIWANTEYYLGHSSIIRNEIMRLRFLYLELKSKIYRNKLKELLKQEFGISEEKVYFVEHHEAHTYSTFFTLNQDKKEKALIFTLDGSGDYNCATVSIAEKGKIKRVSETNWDKSMGYIYSLTTSFLGMRALEHEYKVMGLAPYAKSYFEDTYDRLFKDIISFSKDTLEFNSKFPLNRFNLHLEKNSKGERFDNIAASVQKLTEELILDWISSAINKYKVKNIYLSGGVFMNVKLNKRIMELKQVNYANFMPSCGDESNPIGAAFKMHTVLNPDTTIHPIDNLYLGKKYSDKEILSYIKKNKLDKKYKITKHKDIELKIAKMISKGEIVARFKGRNEFGARALGNRTILADPSKMESFYTVNDQVKMRDFWMPFAPSILWEDHSKYIKNPKNFKAPHMILAFDSTQEGKDKLRAALHQADKTLRPQLVEKQTSPDYHKLINYFKKLTGISAVLNTSLNVHGYPLVSTIKQAFFTMENSELKNLALENFLIQKK